jgi:hypothetical protein
MLLLWCPVVTKAFVDILLVDRQLLGEILDAQAVKTRDCYKGGYSVARHTRAARFLNLGCHAAHSSVFSQKEVNGITLISGGNGKKKMASSIPTELPFEETQTIMCLMDLPTQRWAELVKSSTRSCFVSKGRLSR